MVPLLLYSSFFNGYSLTKGFIVAYQEQVLATGEVQRPMISWGAILAGAFIAFVVNATLMSMGGGIGFSSFDPEQGDSVGRGAMLAAGAFWFIAGLISLFAGGYVAARMSGYRERVVAGLHGLCAWAVASAVTIVLVATGIGSAVGAAVGLVGSGLRGAASAGAGAAANTKFDVSSVREEVRQLLAETGKKELQPENVKARAKDVPQDAARAQANAGGKTGADVAEEQAGAVAGAADKDAVANVISKRLGISKEEANSLIGQSEDQANSVMATIKQKGIAAAGKTTNAAAAAGWFMFFSLVSGAIAAYIGGVFGGPMGFSDSGTTVVSRRREPLTT